jgi:AbrB family looped-hinge helix DNA binding protein
MHTTIDAAGRVVIPALIRERAGLRPGTELELSVDEDGSVRLTRSVPGAQLVKKGQRRLVRPTAAKRALPQVDVAGLVESERSR